MAIPSNVTWIRYNGYFGLLIRMYKKCSVLPTYWPYYDASLTQWWPEGRVDLPTYQREWTKLIETGGRVLAADVSDLRIQIGPGGESAVATYRLRVTTRAADRVDTTQDIQETDVLFRRGDAWRIVHLHYSVAPAK